MTTSVHMALGNWLRLAGIQSLLSLPAPPAACPSQGARPTPKWRAPPLSLSLSLSVPLSLSLSVWWPELKDLYVGLWLVCSQLQKGLQSQKRF